MPTPTTVELSDFDPAHDGNGLALLDAPGARDVVLAAIADAGDVVVTVRYEDAEGRVMEARITGSANRYTAHYAVDGQTTSVVVDGAEAWVLPSAAIANAEGLEESWLCVSPDDALVTRWTPLSDAHSLVEELTEDASGLSAPADDTVDLLLGAEAVEGTLTVALRGAPLPSRLVRADPSGRMEATFTDWGATADVEGPAGC